MFSISWHPHKQSKTVHQNQDSDDDNEDDDIQIIEHKSSRHLSVKLQASNITYLIFNPSIVF